MGQEPDTAASVGGYTRYTPPLIFFYRVLRMPRFPCDPLDIFTINPMSRADVVILIHLEHLLSSIVGLVFRPTRHTRVLLQGGQF
jgi:hypothetical protein